MINEILWGRLSDNCLIGKSHLNHVEASVVLVRTALNQHLNPFQSLQTKYQEIITSLVYCHKLTKEQDKLSKTQWLLLLSVTSGNSPVMPQSHRPAKYPICRSNASQPCIQETWGNRDSGLSRNTLQFSFYVDCCSWVLQC